MDDRHFQCFQHRPLGRAHWDFFRRLAIFIGAKKVLLSSGACLDLSASPGEQSCFEGKAYVRSHLRGKCCLIKESTFNIDLLSTERRNEPNTKSLNCRLFWEAKKLCSAPVFNLKLCKWKLDITYTKLGGSSLEDSVTFSLFILNKKRDGV